MTPVVPASRLAQSLCPLGLIGSILLHGAVLAALLERPAPSARAPQPETPVIFHVAIAVAPAPGPDSGAPPEPEPEPFSPRPENLLPESPVPESPVSAPLVPEASPTPPGARAPAPPPITPPQRPRPVAKPAPKRLAPKSATPAQTLPIPLPPAVPQAAPAPEPGPGPGQGPGQGPILNLPTAPVQITRIRARDQRPPVYPEGARRDELEGTVRLKLTVSPSGQVEEAAVLKSSGHRLLDQAAQSAARLWQLYPAEQDGKPVAGWAEVEIPFRLTD